MSLFDSASYPKTRRNKFDLSHEKKFTFNMGTLVPALCLELVPGDHVRIQSNVFLRFLALVAPIMHRVNVTVHYFAVPYRLLWSSWEDFITGGRDGTLTPSMPYCNPGDIHALSDSYIQPSSLLDYLGFPVMNVGATYQAGYNSFAYQLLPLRAYMLVYDTFYRDQNIEASVLPATFKDSGHITGSGNLEPLLNLRNRAWEKLFYQCVALDSTW